MYKCDKLLQDLNYDYEEYNKALKDYEDAVNIFNDYYTHHKENTLKYIYDNSTLFTTENYEDNEYLDFDYGCFIMTISNYTGKLVLSNNVEYYDKNGVFFGTYDIEEVK